MAMVAHHIEPQKRAATLRCGIYCRVSTRLQADNYSLADQEKDCAERAARIPATVVGVWRDVDSGYELDLPGLNQMLSAAERREFDVLILPDIDRLARNLAKQLLILAELKGYGVEVRDLTGPIADTDERTAMTQMRGVFAEFERSKIRRRTMNGRRAKVEAGHVLGAGPAPFGYQYVRAVVGKRERTVGLAPDPATAPVVQRIIRELQTRSVAAVCQRLTAEDIPTPGALAKRRALAAAGEPFDAVPPGRWASATIVDLFKTDLYAGRYQYGRFACHKVSGQKHSKRERRDAGDLLTIAVPALVSQAEFDAARLAMNDRKVRRSCRAARHGDDPYLLRARLTCGCCGGPLASMQAGTKKARSYLCLRSYPSRARIQQHPGCAMPSVQAERLEQHVWRLVKSTLLDGDYLAAGLAKAQQASDAAKRQRERLTWLTAEIDRRQTALDRQVLALLKVEPDSPVYQALEHAVPALEAEITSLRAECAELRTRPVEGLSADAAEALLQFAARIRARLDQADAKPATQRRIYDLLRLRVTVTPGGNVRLTRDRDFTVEPQALIDLRLHDGRSLQGYHVQDFPSDSAPDATAIGRSGAREHQQISGT